MKYYYIKYNTMYLSYMDLSSDCASNDFVREISWTFKPCSYFDFQYDDALALLDKLIYLGYDMNYLSIEEVEHDED